MTDNFKLEPLSDTTEMTTEKKTKKSGCFGFFIDTVETILLAVILFLAINAVSARVRVENISMKPTLQPGEFLLVNRVAYKWGEPSIGDIVIFHAPGESELDYIKRVIGVPGDVVRIEGGTVYINNQALYEPYISAPPSYTGEWIVPIDEYFVLGDNRNSSSDSHLWGFVPKEDLVGRALLIYWPLNDFTLLRTPESVQAIQ